MEEPAKDSLGYRPRRGRKARDRSAPETAELFADERCCKAIPGLPSDNRSGRSRSVVSAWENREREEYLAHIAEEEARPGGEE